ncbi:IS1167, transposase [Streptococcus agalactiae GD201008-001]|nr:IS1167, transposase [Streptococcus agalactiae GD201008-001]
MQLKLLLSRRIVTFFVFINQRIAQKLIEKTSMTEIPH